MKRPSCELMDGTVVDGTATEIPLVSTDTRSIFGRTVNDTEHFSVLPVLSVPASTTVKLPAAVGVPVTSPEVAVRDKPDGTAPLDTVQGKGKVLQGVAKFAEYTLPTTPYGAVVVVPKTGTSSLAAQPNSPNPRAKIDNRDARDFIWGRPPRNFTLAPSLCSILLCQLTRR
jgi:hypothetical protein